MQKYQRLNTKGFTLIEVLLSGVILIICVSAMSLIYRTATISSTKASNNVKLLGNVNLVIQNIQNTIRNGNAIEPLNGKGKVGNIRYQWRSRLEKKSGAPQRFSAEDGIWQTQPDRFYLWDVELIIEMGSRSKHYQFKEVSWQAQ